MNRNSTLTPVLFALAAVVLFSTGGLCIKWIPFPALHLAGLRAVIAAAFLGAYMGYHGGFPQISKMGRYSWFASFSYFAMITSYVFAMKMTTAVNAIFLQYTMPAWVLVGGAIWLKERITMGRVTVVGLCFFGMLLFFIDELQPRQWTGNIVALFSGLTFAALTLSLRKVREQRPMDCVFMGNVLAGVFLLPLAFWTDPGQIAHFTSLSVIGTLLWLGIFQIGVAYLFFVAAIQGLPAIEVAIISLIEPILNPTWVFIFLDERPTFWAIIGGTIIMVSVLLRTFFAEEVED